MPLSVNHGGNLRRQFLNRQLQTTNATNTGLSQQKILRYKKHITRYRRNWDIFAKEVLGLKT